MVDKWLICVGSVEGEEMYHPPSLESIFEGTLAQAKSYLIGHVTQGAPDEWLEYNVEAIKFHGLGQFAYSGVCDCIQGMIFDLASLPTLDSRMVTHHAA